MTAIPNVINQLNADRKVANDQFNESPIRNIIKRYSLNKNAQMNKVATQYLLLMYLKAKGLYHHQITYNFGDGRYPIHNIKAIQSKSEQIKNNISLKALYSLGIVNMNYLPNKRFTVNMHLTKFGLHFAKHFFDSPKYLKKHQNWITCDASWPFMASWPISFALWGLGCITKLVTLQNLFFTLAIALMIILFLYMFLEYFVLTNYINHRNSVSIKQLLQFAKRNKANITIVMLHKIHANVLFSYNSQRVPYKHLRISIKSLN